MTAVGQALEELEQRITNALGERGMSQFFRDTGVSRSSWYRWKKGEAIPNLKTWLECQEAVKVIEKEAS